MSLRSSFAFSLMVSVPMFALSAGADTIVSASATTTGLGSPAAVIQVENALGGAVQGASTSRPANTGLRTAYYWNPDITGDNGVTPCTAGVPRYEGSAWAVTFHGSGSLVVDSSATATVTLGAVQSTGLVDGLGNSIDRSPVLVDGLPIYQYFRDS